MTGFSDRIWQHTTPLRESIHALPFNTELAAGTLPRQTFQFYIVQDALYLDQYARWRSPEREVPMEPPCARSVITRSKPSRLSRLCTDGTCGNSASIRKAWPRRSRLRIVSATRVS